MINKYIYTFFVTFPWVFFERQPRTILLTCQPLVKINKRPLEVMTVCLHYDRLCCKAVLRRRSTSTEAKPCSYEREIFGQAFRCPAQALAFGDPVEKHNGFFDDLHDVPSEFGLREVAANSVDIQFPPFGFLVILLCHII